MRHAVASILAVAFATLSAHAEGYGPGLTVLLDFREAASPESLGEMQREVRHLLAPAGLKVHLKLKSELQPDETFDDLVIVRFQGSCSAPQDPMLIDERGPGPLALSHTMGGEIQPFSEVACDSVRRAVESALWGDQRKNREELFGRALGRVVAHELVHIVGRTARHGKSGVFKTSLSGSQLIADRMSLDGDDALRIRKSLTR